MGFQSLLSNDMDLYVLLKVSANSSNNLISHHDADEPIDLLLHFLEGSVVIFNLFDLELVELPLDKVELDQLLPRFFICFPALFGDFTSECVLHSILLLPDLCKSKIGRFQDVEVYEVLQARQPIQLLKRKLLLLDAFEILYPGFLVVEEVFNLLINDLPEPLSYGCFGVLFRMAHELFLDLAFRDEL